MDNHALLGRLEGLKSDFNMKKVDADHQVNQLHMVNASYSARKNGKYDKILEKKMKASMSRYNSLPPVSNSKGSSGASSSTAAAPRTELPPAKKAAPQKAEPPKRAPAAKPSASFEEVMD